MRQMFPERSMAVQVKEKRFKGEESCCGASFGSIGGTRQRRMTQAVIIVMKTVVRFRTVHGEYGQ
jgi:hypothetical protein